MYQFQLEQELKAKNDWLSTVINHNLYMTVWLMVFVKCLVGELFLTNNSVWELLYT
jgi:hypothetical protein